MKHKDAVMAVLRGVEAHLDHSPQTPAEKELLEEVRDLIDRIKED